MNKAKYYDQRLRKLLKKKEFDILFAKLLFKNSKISFLYKSLLLKYLKKKKLFISQTNKFCIVTQRSRSVYKVFRISRIVLRDLGSQGLIPGLRKSSW